jgi:hypothetical protein
MLKNPLFQILMTRQGRSFMVAAAKKSADLPQNSGGVPAQLVEDFQDGFSSCFDATLDLGCLSVRSRERRSAIRTTSGIRCFPAMDRTALAAAAFDIP